MKQIVFQSNSKSNLTLKQFSINYPEHPHLNRINARYDFSDEWNNLGYGEITSDNSKWAISLRDTSSLNFSKVVAEALDELGYSLCAYCGIFEANSKATLWFNREVGPTDGLDYYVIEDFLTNYKTEKYGSVPILSEIPYGFKSGVTMRIDCDEHIASGQRLADLYKEMNVPFSLAIKTSLDFDQANKNTIFSVLDAGGSVVSHSHTHAPNWGGSREQTKWEAEVARDRLQTILPKDYNYDYVVSPFHQNPQYAVQGLVDAGIKGFVGGIIKNDPEYLQARAGYVSTGEDIITHSQQCMLHGDCYHNAGNSIEVYKQSFENHYNTNTFFGFLDHPFSNYKYGWNDEEERIKVHKEFLEHIQTFSGIWFANLIDAMNFLLVKSNTKVWLEEDRLYAKVSPHSLKVPDLKVLWAKGEYRIKSNVFSPQLIS
ncbi:MAG: polysaccharide deacetylase [Peredibacter sp.]|nr:polysaccharide deacetylase [Peredibacter sp.]